MRNILFLDACPRSESRTRRLAEALLARLEGEVTTLRLAQLDLRPLDEASLSHRNELLERGALSDPAFALARQFAAADEIVLAAPFWDLSFPAIVKLYCEQIYITGVTSRYSPEGVPEGLCRAARLHYVTTAGGPYIPDYSFGYIRSLAQDFFGIPEVRLVAAENLDLVGADPEAILAARIAQL